MENRAEAQWRPPMTVCEVRCYLHSDLRLQLLPFLLLDQFWVVVLGKIPRLVFILPQVCGPEGSRKEKDFFFNMMMNENYYCNRKHKSNSLFCVEYKFE